MARIEPGLERRMQGNTGVTGGPLLPGGEVTTLTALVAAKDKEDKFFVKPRLHSSTAVSPLCSLHPSLLTPLKSELIAPMYPPSPLPRE